VTSEPTGPAGNDLSTSNDQDTDRLAWELFRLLRDRSTDDRLYVFRALTARLSAGPTGAPERVTLATNALAACMDAIGKVPSRRSYDDWRREQERPSEWPSATSIRNLFGPSWAKALDALGVKPAPDVLARRLLNIGRGYTAEDVLAALRVCATALSPERLTFAIYHEWAQQELADPSGPRQRLPLSSTVFCHHFGSWAGALTAAGYPELVSNTGSHRKSRPHGPAENYTEDRILDCVREAARESKRSKVTHKLTMPRYERWRDEKVEEAEARGEVLFIPSVQVPLTRFGSWPLALRAAGLATEEEARLAPQRGFRRLTDHEVLACVLTALADTGYPTPDSANGWKVTDTEEPVAGRGGPDPGGRDGGGDPGRDPGDTGESTIERSTSSRDKAKAPRPKLWLTRADYNRWRRERLLKADYPGPRVCGDQLIRVRFGSWVEVIALANERLEAQEMANRDD
jgi:hypothetical protein